MGNSGKKDLGTTSAIGGLPQIPVTTDASLVMSRHSSLYSTGYRPLLPTIASSRHYANTLFWVALQDGQRNH